jgi:hypothetical protein
MGIVKSGLAGLLVGVLFSIRYAAGFLGLAAVVIIFQAVNPNWRVFFKRSLVFGGAVAAVGLPVLFFVWRGPLPVSGMYRTGPEIAEVRNLAAALPFVTRLIFGNAVAEKCLAIAHRPALSFAVGILSAVVVFTAPWLLFRHDRRWRKNGAVGLAICSAALLLFLLVVSRGWFLGIPRYYEPMSTAAILTYSAVAYTGSFRKAAAIATRLVAITSLAFSAVYLAAEVRTHAGRNTISKAITGFAPAEIAPHIAGSIQYGDWLRVYTRKEESRLRVNELFESNRDAVFVADRYPLFLYDWLKGGPKPGLQIRDIKPEATWTSAFSSSGKKVFWVVEDTKLIPSLHASGREIYRNKFERMIIYEMDIPAGTRVPVSYAGRMPRGEW